MEKHMDYRVFLLGRSTLPTMTGLSIIRLALVWCTFLFATVFFKHPKLPFSQLHPLDHPLSIFKGKAALPDKPRPFNFFRIAKFEPFGVPKWLNLTFLNPPYEKAQLYIVTNYQVQFKHSWALSFR